MKILIASFLFCTSLVRADCLILNTQNKISAKQFDPLYLVLVKQARCPSSVQELTRALASDGLSTSPSMVANRGRHNPTLGSFSFFEQVTGNLSNFGAVRDGEFFFGHFTAKDGEEVVLDQSPEKGKLLIEALAWDKRKGLFNFYELIGTGETARWFCRGDSSDILKDNAYIYRDAPSGIPKFGNRLRCSACHASGGPIMKEIKAPHNDWWTTTSPLIFQPNRPSEKVLSRLNHIADASVFSQRVQAGILKLERSPTYQALRSQLSLQEQLRPLFCENEINLESDLKELDADERHIQIPSAFFLSPLFGGSSSQIPKSTYQKLVAAKQLRFPETARTDADHAWLTPVKGFSDLLAIQSLVERGIVDLRFVLAVLTVDSVRPLLSASRCELLKLIPERSENWIEKFKDNLGRSQQAGAAGLLKLLRDPAISETSLKELARAKLREVIRLEELSGFAGAFESLIDVRRRVGESEISQNPRGQILEPGFRVIFPETL